MKNKRLQFVVAGLLLLAAVPAFAQEKTPDEKNLDKASMEVDNDAAKPEAGKTVTDKLKSEFGVDDARLQGLRDQNLGYGEISVALSLAQNLPGGINDANVQKVLALRQGPPVMGWGKVARELGFKLGPVVSKVKKISTEARKKAAAEKAAAAKEKGRKDGGGEKAGKPERHGKMERQEKGQRPDKHGKR